MSVADSTDLEGIGCQRMCVVFGRTALRKDVDQLKIAKVQDNGQQSSDQDQPRIVGIVM